MDLTLTVNLFFLIKMKQQSWLYVNGTDCKFHFCKLSTILCINV